MRKVSLGAFAEGFGKKAATRTRSYMFGLVNSESIQGPCYEKYKGEKGAYHRRHVVPVLEGHVARLYNSWAYCGDMGGGTFHAKNAAAAALFSAKEQDLDQQVLIVPQGVSSDECTNEEEHSPKKQNVSCGVLEAFKVEVFKVVSGREEGHGRGTKMVGCDWLMKNKVCARNIQKLRCPMR